MTRCEELRPLLDLHLDGELPEETARKMERHLLRCADCAFAMRALEQTRSLLREAVPREEPSPAFRERAAARLLDAFADRLRTPADERARQWTLPFATEEG